MNIEVIIQNSDNGKIFEVSEITSSVKWETELINQPGKATIDLIDTKNLYISEGSTVSIKSEGQNVFFGYVFIVSKKESALTLTAYDQMRYLKNKDLYKFSNMTASQIFSKICKDFELAHKVNQDSLYILPTRLYDNKSLFDIIDWSITETLANTGEWFMIRDNFGTLEFNNLKSLKTNLFIGDESLLTNYSYEGSIDSDTYNQVKLIQENEKTKKREMYVVKDSSTIKKWGTLQYFEKIDNNTNEAKIKSRAEQLLKLKNRTTKSLNLNCLGDLRVFAGCGVIVSINTLEAEGLSEPKYFVVKKCTHNFSNNLHTMDLEMQVSV